MGLNLGRFEYVGPLVFVELNLGAEPNGVREREAAEPTGRAEGPAEPGMGPSNGVRKVFISSAGDVLGKGAERAAKGFCSAGNDGPAG
jgi:hypothetical protein